MEPAARGRSTTVTVFALLNFIFTFWMLLAALLFVGALVYGIGFSGDPLEEKIGGGIIGAILVLILLCSALVHLVAGVGLLWLKRWGYYAHLAGAVVESCSCLGVAYTTLAFIFALQDDFKSQFFPPRP